MFYFLFDAFLCTFICAKCYHERMVCINMCLFEKTLIYIKQKNPKKTSRPWGKMHIFKFKFTEKSLSFSRRFITLWGAPWRILFLGQILIVSDENLVYCPDIGAYLNLFDDQGSGPVLISPDPTSFSPRKQYYIHETYDLKPMIL